MEKISENLLELFARQRGTAVLWAPVGLTLGIWFYFSLPLEPTFWLTGAIASGAATVLLLARRHRALTFFALILCGFVLAKARTESVATPLLRSPTGEIAVVGVVSETQGASARRGTLILQPSEIEGLARERIPHRLRLSNLTRNGTPPVGARVAFKVRLAPIASPTMPGGFDYGRQLYFDGIGGTGRVTSPIQVLDQSPPARMWLQRQLNDVRVAIGNRIRLHLDGTVAALADATITGERTAIPKDVNKSLQISGLFHILSISGLHMSLAAGGVFWVIRALLAFIPQLALNYPIKKWAAAVALLFGMVYMLLAGAQAATQRSYIMLAVIFLAIILDRPAISLRNLALAALVILVSQPESAIQASFQMSFMAVMGLAAFFEYWNRPRVEPPHRIESRASWLWRKICHIVAASILTTLVAGAFSSIPAAYHFGRLAPYGVVANGLAIPVMSLLVMPAALLSVVLMPFGLEALPLAALGRGLELVLAISDMVEKLPGAQRVVPQLPSAGAICLAMGGALLCLLRGRLRWSGVALLGIGLVIAQYSNFPDLLIERTAANVAFRNANGELVFASPLRGRFAAEKWLQANGEEAGLRIAAVRSGWNCDSRSCRTSLKGKSIAYFFEGAGEEPSCVGVDVLIANYPLRHACRAVPIRIDRIDAWRKGSHAITIEGNATTVQSARDRAGSRPWVVVPEPRSKLAAASWRGASTHSPFSAAGSLREHGQVKNQHQRTQKRN